MPEPIERCYYFSTPPADLTEALFFRYIEPSDPSDSVRIVLYIRPVDDGPLYRTAPRDQAENALVIYLRIGEKTLIDDNDPKLVRIYIPITDQTDLKDRLVRQGWRVVENGPDSAEWFVIVPNTPRMVERFLLEFPPDPRGLVWAVRLGLIVENYLRERSDG